MARMKKDPFFSLGLVDSLRQRIQIRYDGDKIAIESEKKRFTLGEFREVAHRVEELVKAQDHARKKLL